MEGQPIKHLRFGKSHLVLGAILAGAVLLRLVHIDFGLPLLYHPDEVSSIAQIQRLAAGRIAFMNYRHPPLMRTLGALGLACANQWTPAAAREQPTSAALALRLISAAADSATVLMLFLLAGHFVSRPYALLAAALYAVLPAAVFHAKYGLPDPLLTLLVASTVWLSFLIYERPLLLRYFFGGLIFMLGVAAKYNAVFALGSIAAAHLLARGRPPLAAGPEQPRKRSSAQLASLAAGGGLGFIVGFPWLFFERRSFWNTGLGEWRHLFQAGHGGLQIGGWANGYGFHFLYSVLPSTGYLLLLAVLLGLGYFLASFRSAKTLILLATVLPLYAATECAYKVPPSFARYALPLLPFYMLAAVAAWEAAAGRWPRTGQHPVWGACAAALLLGAYPAYGTLRLLGTVEPDTRAIMNEWLERRLAPKTRVLYEGLRCYYPSGRQLIWVALQPQDFTRPPGQLNGDYIITSSLAADRWQRWPWQKPEIARFYSRLEQSGSLLHEVRPAYKTFQFHNPGLRLYRISAGRADP